MEVYHIILTIFPANIKDCYTVFVNNANEHFIQATNKEDTKINLYGPGILDSLHTILLPSFGEGSFLIVTDGTIWEAVARHFSLFLKNRPTTTLYILPAQPAPYASDALLANVAAVLAASRAVPIAVGAGTINDIVKRASFENGRRYVCVPTAPSVDGFTSFGAAITVAGFKTTLECSPPLCIVADEDIIVRAPPVLVASGYGDILAKLTSGADWIIADLMGIEAIDPVAWDLAQSAAINLLPRGEAIRKGDKESIGILYKGLISTGLAIQKYNDSRPASGTEHLLSHTWEMFYPQNVDKNISHGFKVAVGTLISAAFMQEMFCENGIGQKLFRRGELTPCQDVFGYRMKLAELIPPETPMKPQTINTIRTKTPPKAEISRRIEWAVQHWPELSKRVLRQVPAFEVLKKALSEASCPVEPGQIGLSRQACVDSVRLASLIRSRYTVLDLAAEMGALDTVIEAVFSPRYFKEYASV